jgi:hypothetical protein
MMPNDRCSFEVVYKKDKQGEEVIDSVVVRTGVSDAAVTLTIPQVYNLARLLDVIPPSPQAERLPDERRTTATPERPRAVVLRSDGDQASLMSSGSDDAPKVVNRRMDVPRT